MSDSTVPDGHHGNDDDDFLSCLFAQTTMDDVEAEDGDVCVFSASSLVLIQYILCFYLSFSLCVFPLFAARCCCMSVRVIF